MTSKDDASRCFWTERTDAPVKAGRRGKTGAKALKSLQQVMKILTDMRSLSRIKRPVVTLGNFDGLHLGHLRIIRKVRERAIRLGCPSLVYTFDPHPLKGRCA